MNSTQEVLTIKQVAEFLQVSTDTVYRLATSGELQGRKIGRIWRFPKDAIENYIRELTGNTSHRDETAKGALSGAGSLGGAKTQACRP